MNVTRRNSKLNMEFNVANKEKIARKMKQNVAAQHYLRLLEAFRQVALKPAARLVRDEFNRQIRALEWHFIKAENMTGIPKADKLPETEMIVAHLEGLLSRLR